MWSACSRSPGSWQAAPFTASTTACGTKPTRRTTSSRARSTRAASRRAWDRSREATILARTSGTRSRLNRRRRTASSSDAWWLRGGGRSSHPCSHPLPLAARSDSRVCERLENLVGAQEIEGVVHDLRELDCPGLVDDEECPLRVAVDRACLVGLHRAVGGEHLAAEVGEKQLLAAIFLLPGVESEEVIRADAHDLGAHGLEARQGRLEAGQLLRSRGSKRRDERVENHGAL